MIRRATARSYPPRRRIRHEPEPQLALAEAARLHHAALAADNRTPASIAFYALVVRRFSEFLGGVPTVTDITPEAARGWIGWLRDEHVSRNNLTGQPLHKGSIIIRQHVVGLKALTRWLEAEELIERDPLARLRLPKADTPAIRPFTGEQVQELIAAAAKTRLPERNVAILYLLLDTGLRASELCRLSLTDVDEDGGRAVVNLAKNGRGRAVYFGAETAEKLRAYRAVRPKLVDNCKSTTSSNYFLTETRLPLNRFALHSLFHSLGESAGISDQVRCSPHNCRHTMATVMAKSHPGALFLLQERLGHSDLAMSRRYSRYAEADTLLPGPSPVELLVMP